MQYTLRNVPEIVDAVLRRRAREQAKSLNDVALDALARGTDVAGHPGRRRDLADVAGTWRTDRAFGRALAAQDAVDRELWK